MNYELRLTVPKNTTKELPVEATLKIHPGVVTRVRLLWPARTSQLGHAQVLHWGIVVWPPYDDQNFTGDGVPIEWNEEYEILDAPYELVVRAWNDDDTYSHTLTFGVAILPADTTAGGGVLKRLTDFFVKFGQGQI
jgi:hypothetical protein